MFNVAPLDRVRLDDVNILVERLVQNVDSVPEELNRVRTRFAEEVEVALIILEAQVDILPFPPRLDSPRIDKLSQKLLCVDTCYKQIRGKEWKEC